MQRTLGLSLAAAVVILSGTALAQTIPQPAATPSAPAARPEMTRDAVAERATAMFARLDTNTDGKIDAADREQASEDRTEARFDRLDTDGNGAISREEFAAQVEARDTRRGGGMARGMRGRGGNGHAMLSGADANSDGAVTQAELSAAMLARFDAADADSDGTVSREERRAARMEAGGGDRRGEGRRHRGHGQRDTNG
jgi:Ca2+-binding EF-hand superfamily protein